jgi:hypothetical protein
VCVNPLNSNDAEFERTHLRNLEPGEFRKITEHRLNRRDVEVIASRTARASWEERRVWACLFEDWYLNPPSPGDWDTERKIDDHLQQSGQFPWSPLLEGFETVNDEQK